MKYVIYGVTFTVCTVVLAAIYKDLTVGLDNPSGYEKVIHALIAIISLYIGSKIKDCNDDRHSDSSNF